MIKNLIEFPPIDFCECPQEINGITSVKYYPESNDVYDMHDKYIGKGKVVEGYLFVEKDEMTIDQLEILQLQEIVKP